MKLEIGMYVRTKYGIAKITDIICGQDVKFDNDSIFDDEDMKKLHEYDGISKNDYFFKKEVTKASFNITDLICEGDYINGLKVFKDDIYDFLYVQCIDGDGNLYCESITKKSFINNIKSIVTKEQMEQESYKVNNER